MDKSASPTSVDEPGATVTFTVDVKNTSGESVTLTDLTDDKFGDLLDDANNNKISNSTCTDNTSIAAGDTYTCSLDAGREFQGRHLTVRAYGERERLLARDVVDTLAFPRPVQASANVLMVPVVAVSRSGDPPALSDETVRCELAGKPCRVRDARRLTAANDGVFIEILIDISLSVIVDRDEISDAVHAILDAAPEPRAKCRQASP